MTKTLIKTAFRTASAAIIGVLFTARLVSGAEYVIDQKRRQFSQTQITIKPHDTLVFRNSDDVSHNVFSVSKGMEFDIRRQAPGGSSKVAFDKDGVAEVRCSIHPKMRLVVTIKK